MTTMTPTSGTSDDDVVTTDFHQHRQLRTTKTISPPPIQHIKVNQVSEFSFLYNCSAATTMATSTMAPVYQCQLTQQVSFFFAPLAPVSSVNGRQHV